MRDINNCLSRQVTGRGEHEQRVLRLCVLLNRCLEGTSLRIGLAVQNVLEPVEPCRPADGTPVRDGSQGSKDLFYQALHMFRQVQEQTVGMIVQSIGDGSSTF